MTKEQQIEEIMLTIPQKIVAYNSDPKGQHLYGEQRLQIAESLYNAGYRKVPKGSFICSGREANLDIEVCNNCAMQQANELFERDKEIDRLKAENKQLQEQLNSANAGNVNCSGCALVEINAVKEFAERVKFETTVDNRLCVREYDIGYNDGYSEAYYNFHKTIDELLKEYEK